MYSDLKNVQIIIALLKEYGIKRFVISPGNRHVPLVHSIEEDSFFECYSIVDERSAAFFALGIIQERQQPVGICCTSGTAICNYVSAVAEAYYQQLPLIIITADRNPYYLYQQEEQMIPQKYLFRDMIKKEVTLPIVRDEKDAWYCERLVNEALLELEHREKGPVHINFPVENNYPINQGIVKFREENLPKVIKIKRTTLESSYEEWIEKYNELSTSKILILCGQRSSYFEQEIEIINKFAENFNCAFSIDHLSNLHCEKSISTFLINRTLTLNEYSKIAPDIVITINANTISEIKGKLLTYSGKFKHWHVSKEGQVSDPFRCITDIIECSPITFFRKFSEMSNGKASRDYYNEWEKILNKRENLLLPDQREFRYSGVYVVQQLMKDMPRNSLFHIANSNSIRISNFFKLDPSINVYCNRGTNGIDGSMSSFIGQASVSEKLSFLLIGDLSFFYDMNGLWNQYISKNMRIMVCNNSGGAIFHVYPGLGRISTVDRHIAAEHSTSVREWAICRGFKYMSASTKEEIEKQMIYFYNKNAEKPIMFEVFTDKEVDREEIENVSKFYGDTANKMERMLASHIPVNVKNKIMELHHEYSGKRR